VQSGSYVTDVVERTSSLMNPNWTGVYTNAHGYITPTFDNFDGSEARTNTVYTTNNPAFFKVRRAESTTP
jgi:hypothetical protein